MNKAKPQIYIAGPYRIPCPIQNTRRAVIAGQLIRDQLGVVVCIPHLSMTEDLICPRLPEYWLQITMDQMLQCDAVYRIPGYSLGSDAEVAEAGRVGIPVLNDIYDLTKWVHNWKKVNDQNTCT